MERIGLTGGLGMGKSTVAGMFAARGLPVVDTDQLARQVVEPGQPAWEEILQTFGRDIAHPDGRLNRSELARRVFRNPEARRRLEAITHPRIRERWHQQMAAWEAAGVARAMVVIPLLYEVGAEAELDRVVCVACQKDTQWERLRARGWSEEEIQLRLAAQWPVEEKMARAHHVIWTEGSLSATEAQVEHLLARWKAGPHVSNRPERL
ncbi:dephospho-CoA kinase [Limisphaera sp. VF-2]|jgi:dephospho-CoA kinase|uniref:dephospho-CoA kinase n=1 Tax=Limisphaera sp. VF-2 TaxID=3400418 RepID=UPI0017768EC3|nr:dephospho-CoA kinase [Limisphaera sp.]